jgi:predicted  nucleic acid-binding Zn-ribbon protein
MIAEGSSSSSQTPVPRGGPTPPSERDLLAERRARRAAESGENALVRRAETAEATVKTLEGHVSSLQQRLEDAEQDGRRTAELAERLENVEGALQAIRESHRRMAMTVSELKGVAMRLRAAVDSEPPREPSSARPRSEEMADALAAAVERLRARAEATVVARPDTPGVSPIARESHKHSMSLIGRWRLRRKQRRGR